MTRTADPDIALRAAGFRIAGRPGNNPALATWTRAGRTYTQAEALKVTLREKAKQPERELRGGL